MPFFKWSKTAASNASADNTINWAEGQPPGSVNDSARAMMARLAEYRDDTSGGGFSTAGTSTAYTIATNQIFDSLADMARQMIGFVVHTTNGATVTLNVDGLGAKPLRSALGVELPSGVLVQGTPYTATYNNADGVWYLRNFYVNPYSIPIGGLMPYVGGSAPNSSFVLPFGQAISRTTYATLFALTSTTFGIGDGSTTFNVPDLRNLAIFGLGNMGGSDRGLITSAVSGITGTTIGASGGSQSHTMTAAEIAAHAHASGSLASANPNIGGQNALGIANGTGGQAVNNNQPSPSVNIFNTSSYGTIVAGAISGSTGSAGSATPFAIMPPAMVLPYIMRII